MIRRRSRTNTAIEHNVRSHASAVVFQRGKTSTSHRATRIGNALNGLQRLQIQTIVVIVSNDQIRFVRSANQLHSDRIHILLDVGCRYSSATVRQPGESNRLPERIAGAIDTAVSAGRRCIRNSRREAGNVLAAVARSIQIDITGNTVSQLRFGNVHTTVEQVDNRFLAAVLNHFQTADRYRSSVLRDTKLRRTDRAVLTDVQHFVTRIRIRVVRRAVVVHYLLQDDVTARKRFHVSAFFQPAQKRVIVCYVVGQLTATTLYVGRNDVADRAIGKSHN